MGNSSSFSFGKATIRQSFQKYVEMKLEIVNKRKKWISAVKTCLPEIYFLPLVCFAGRETFFFSFRF
jgi:hypothetical protein